MRVSYKPAGALRLHVEPLTLLQANDLVIVWHRHHGKKQNHRFSIGVFDEDGMPHGAATVDRPASNKTEQYHIAEVSRLVTDGTPNACSMLYQASARIAQHMGFWRIQTYILQSEPGTSLKAAGWGIHHVAEHCPTWNNNTRKRTVNPESDGKVKVLWFRDLNSPRAVDEKIFHARAIRPGEQRGARTVKRTNAIAPAQPQ